MKKKNIIAIFIIIILIPIIVIIYYYIPYYRTKCVFLKGDNFTYCKIMKSGDEYLVWENAAKERFRKEYSYMKDYFYQKLLENKDRTILYPLFLYNEILNKDKMKNYLDNCLDKETNQYILDYCIRWEMNFGTKEEVLKKIDKFKNSDNEFLRKSYKFVINN